MKFLSSALLIFCCFAQQEHDIRQTHCQIQQRVLWWENDWTDIKNALAECEDANEPYNRLECNAGAATNTIFYNAYQLNSASAGCHYPRKYRVHTRLPN